MDAKKMGNIPDGGGAAHPRPSRRPQTAKGRAGPTFTPPWTTTAASPTPNPSPTITVPTVIGFFTRTLAYFQRYGVTIEGPMTDNHPGYTRSEGFAELLNRYRIKHITIKPHRPWQNGKTEHYNRTLKPERANQQAWPNEETKTQALPD